MRSPSYSGISGWVTGRPRSSITVSSPTRAESSSSSTGSGRCPMIAPRLGGGDAHDSRGPGSPLTTAMRYKRIVGMDMPLREAMETQRAIRRLKPDPVDDELILRCIDLALKAPTGSNAQNWEWIVVRDPGVKAKLARFNRQAWRVYGGLGRLFRGDDPKVRKVIDAVQWQADHFEEI